MDTLSRFERIGYPAFSWLVAAGRSSLVPWSLVIVNVIGLACLGALGAVIAREAATPRVVGSGAPRAISGSSGCCLATSPRS